METKLGYDGDFSKIVTISTLRKQVFLNAICITSNLLDAATEAGVHLRTLSKFVDAEEISLDQRRMMRKEFKKLKLKVKYRTKI
jgi:hypothetical protein